MDGFNADAVRAEARRLIIDVLARKKSKVKPDEVKEGVSLTRQLGIDSLDILQIMATVEKRFKLRVPDEEIKTMDDLGGILRALEKNWPQGA